MVLGLGGNCFLYTIGDGRVCVQNGGRSKREWLTRSGCGGQRKERGAFM